MVIGVEEEGSGGHEGEKLLVGCGGREVVGAAKVVDDVGAVGHRRLPPKAAYLILASGQSFKVHLPLGNAELLGTIERAQRFVDDGCCIGRDDYGAREWGWPMWDGDPPDDDGWQELVGLLSEKG